MTLAQDRPVTPTAGLPARPRTVPPPRSAAPPPRPRVTSDLPLPGTAARPGAPWAVRAGGTLWALSLLAGVLGVITASIDLAGLRSGLLDSARAGDPGRATAVLEDGVDLVVAGAAVFTGLALLTLLSGLVLLRGRRPAARWLLPLAGLLILTTAGIDQGLVAGGATGLDRLSFLVEGGLAVLALGVLLARSSRAWLRRR